MKFVLNALAGGFLVLPNWAFYFDGMEDLRECDKKEILLNNRFLYTSEVRAVETDCGLLT